MAACFNCSSSSSPDQQRQKIQLPNSLFTFPTTSLYNSHSAATNTTSNSMINGHGDDNHLLSSQHSLPSVPSLQKTTSSVSNYSSKTTTTSSLISSTCLPGSSSSAIHSLAVFNHRLFAGTPSSALVFPNIPKDLTCSTQLFSLPSFGAVKSFSFAATAASKFLIFTGHQDGRIRAWEYSSQSGRYHQFATLPTPGDRLLRSVVPGSRVSVRRHKKRLWIDHIDTVSAVAVAGDLLYSASWDRTIKVWRLSDLRCIESIRAHDDAVNSIVVSVNGLVYTGSADTRIRVWSKSKSPKPKSNVTHSLLATLEKHRSAVNALALNRDGSVLYSGACDRWILVWIRDINTGGGNIHTHEPHMTVCGALRGHKQAILSLVCVSDLLFSGSADSTIRVWSRGIDNQYCPLLVLEGHEKPVKALAACLSGSDPNQICLYSGSLEGEIRSWQIRISINS